MAPITVAIIEDNRLVREGLAALVNELPDMQVVFAATRLDTAALGRSTPDVILLDVGLQEDNSLHLAGEIARLMPATHIIVMDLLPAHEEIAQFVNAGVAGFILKDADFDDFVETVRAVARGERILPPGMTRSLFSQIARVAIERDKTKALEATRMTAREQEVIAAIALGMANKAIASRLNVTTHTVKSHVRNIMDKLALHTRLEIAAYAHAQGDASDTLEAP